MMSDLDIQTTIKVENDEVILHTAPDILQTTPDINNSKFRKVMNFRNVTVGSVVGSGLGKESSETGEVTVGGGSPFHQWDHGYGRTPQGYNWQGSSPNSRTSTINSARTQAVKRRLNLESTPEEDVGFKTPKSRKKNNSHSKSPSPRGLPKTPTRYDTSLGLLTRKFVALLQSSSRGIIDLNYASTHLGVQKRRIYDITNVLEGIGILEKKSKNNIQWRGGTVADSRYNVQQDVENLEKQEKQLDVLIKKAENDVELLSQEDKYAYICYQDLRNIEKFNKRTVMVIKAPHNTTLTIPKALNDEKNELNLKSEKGEIDVFLCPGNKSGKEDAVERFSSAIIRSSSPPPQHRSGDEDSEAEDERKDLFMNPLKDDLSSYPFAEPTTSEGDSSSLCGDLPPPFLSLEPPTTEFDYLYSLDNNEGLTELFDFDCCPL